MLKLNNPLIKKVGGVVGRVVLVLTAVGAFADVFDRDAKDKKLEELESKLTELEDKLNS